MGKAGSTVQHYTAMEITLNFSFVKSLNGLIKLAQLVLVLVLVFVLRFGISHIAVLGSHSDTLFGIGTIVGYAIIIPSSIVTNILGGVSSIMELVFSVTGCVLFIAVAGMCFANNSLYSNLDFSVIIVGILSLVTGVLFLIDLVFILRAHFQN